MEIITQYWVIIITVIGVVVSYTNLKSQNTEQERRLTELETKVEHMNPVLMEIRERLSSIEATLKMLTK